MWETVKAMMGIRMARLIDEGPMPLEDFGSPTVKERQCGLARFKGHGKCRGAHKLATRDSGAVVYWDPKNADLPIPLSEIPDDVIDRHSPENYIETFKEEAL